MTSSKGDHGGLKGLITNVFCVFVNLKIKVEYLLDILKMILSLVDQLSIMQNLKFYLVQCDSGAVFLLCFPDFHFIV